MESVEETVATVHRVADALQPTSLYVGANSDLELLGRVVADAKVLLLGEVSARLKEGSE
jgi:methionine synthase II (cobalamin-independent)